MCQGPVARKARDAATQCMPAAERRAQATQDPEREVFHCKIKEFEQVSSHSTVSCQPC